MNEENIKKNMALFESELDDMYHILWKSEADSYYLKQFEDAKDNLLFLIEGALRNKGDN